MGQASRVVYLPEPRTLLLSKMPAAANSNAPLEPVTPNMYFVTSQSNRIAPISVFMHDGEATDLMGKSGGSLQRLTPPRWEDVRISTGLGGTQ